MALDEFKQELDPRPSCKRALDEELKHEPTTFDWGSGTSGRGLLPPIDYRRAEDGSILAGSGSPDSHRRELFPAPTALLQKVSSVSTESESTARKGKRGCRSGTKTPQCFTVLGFSLVPTFRLRRRKRQLSNHPHAHATSPPAYIQRKTGN